MFALGFGDQILLGMDAARRKYWRFFGGKPGLPSLLREFVPQLRSGGLTQHDIANFSSTIRSTASPSTPARAD
jgi:hypothetical protein